jgi:hypothetical protein
MPDRPAKSRQELCELIFSRLKPHLSGNSLNILIAPVASRYGEEGASWRVAFTTGGRRAVPPIAWQISNDVMNEFDLA